MKFEGVCIAVKDIALSKQFYQDLFGLEVFQDYGINVSFGTLSLQQEFDWLLGIPKENVSKRSYNMELYFEVEDFDAFLHLLEQHSEVKLVHPPKKHDWQQRVVRIYDPDLHMIEIGESMEVIAKRYLAQGLSAEEVAKIIQHPVEFVRQCR